MRVWSDEDVNQLNENHWHEKPTICPACGATVDVKDTGELRPVPLMMASCPGCHQSAQFPAAASQGANYGETEAARLLNLHLVGSQALCPHDGATLVVEDIGGLGSWCYLLRCPRCGASAEVERTS
jgi:endogenous inhibitor of DNA gyrase (YacG/DUF329 family)